MGMTRYGKSGCAGSGRVVSPSRFLRHLYVLDANMLDSPAISARMTSSTSKPRPRPGMSAPCDKPKDRANERMYVDISLEIHDATTEKSYVTIYQPSMLEHQERLAFLLPLYQIYSSKRDQVLIV
jgi:hypothetical protein